MDAARYPANVFWSDEDEGFIAVASDLPGSSAFGETQAEALAQLQQAISAWIEAAQAAGNPVPPPSRPATETHSGKVLLRMPRTLHADLASAAKRDNVSLNQYIVFLLTSATTQHSMLVHIAAAQHFPPGVAQHVVPSAVVEGYLGVGSDWTVRSGWPTQLANTMLMGITTQQQSFSTARTGVIRSVVSAPHKEDEGVYYPVRGMADRG